MKKLAIIAAISALSAESYAATFGLDYAGIDPAYEPPFECDWSCWELTSYAATPFNLNDDDLNSFSTFSINLSQDNGNPGDFIYSADWNYYAGVGYLVANNVVCTSLDEYDFCNTEIMGGLQNNGGFTAVSALDTVTQSPLASPNSTSAAFDLRWTSTTSNGIYDWKLTFAPVPVPAAAWLFGSALVGLAGVKRKQ